jgi:transposase-like protein
MREDTGRGVESREKNEARLTIEEVLRNGAERMLQRAIQVEVAAYLEAHREVVDPVTGRQMVVRNGHLPERSIQTGIGAIQVRQPRVRDRGTGEKFTSKLLPPYMRRVPSLEALIPLLYLKGLSTNEFPEALKTILGEEAGGLSPATIVRLKAAWEPEYEEWAKGSLEGRRYVYFWADGIYLNVRLSEERPCVLVIVGALEDGTKELVALMDGERESHLSWAEVLRELKRRGLRQGPQVAVGDGALGFWAALEEAFPGCQPQRCWVHKTANVLDKLPKKVQPGAKQRIHQMYQAPTKKAALEAYEDFLKDYQAKYPKACECLAKDRDALFSFYDFPAEHWIHLRTTNPIESTFATVTHRQRQTKGNGSRLAALTMAFKLAREAEKHWKKLHHSGLLLKVAQGVKFEDGLELKAA